MSLGPIAFLGSGETSLAGGRIFESLARLIPRPLRIAIMETPAGFELNSAQVAGRVADFLKTRLQNYSPQIDLIPARKRGTALSPDDPITLTNLLQANLIYLGAGSPTYAIRQLRGSLAWDVIRARHRQGATLVFASAAAVSVGAWAIPVYEIYKVGQDVHTIPGLNLFADYHAALSFTPHWNNTDGGAELDTSHCFIGTERFGQWQALLPDAQTIVGFDEHTGLIVDFENRQCSVSGVGSVSLSHAGATKTYAADSIFALRELGEVSAPTPSDSGIPRAVLDMLSSASLTVLQEEQPGAEILARFLSRQQARAEKKWKESDRLRDELAALGWSVTDSADDSSLKRNQNA